jgi:hypothetical protein
LVVDKGAFESQRDSPSANKQSRRWLASIQLHSLGLLDYYALTAYWRSVNGLIQTICGVYIPIMESEVSKPVQNAGVICDE